MSKVTKRELKSQLDGVQNRFAALVKDLKASGYICESVYAPFAHDYQKEPQLKQLDQSVFDGLDEKWRFAAVDKGGAVWVYSGKPDRDCGYWFVKEPVGMLIGRGYDASNWQNSLIERDTAKEPLEVDLSSELTGSELCRAMLERGDKRIMCVSLSGYAMVITGFDGDKFVDSRGVKWGNAAPINNQDEPLAASEVGL